MEEKAKKQVKYFNFVSGGSQRFVVYYKSTTVRECGADRIGLYV